MEKNNKKNSDAQIKAVAKYNKKAYCNISIRIKPIDYNIIDNYARARGISKAALITRAVKYCIGHNIDLVADPDGGNASEDIGGAAEDIGD